MVPSGLKLICLIKHKIGVFMVISKNRKFPQLLLIAFVGVHLDAATVIILWIASVTIHAPCPTIISAHLQPVMHSVYQLVPLVLFLYLACSTDRRIRLRLLYLHARDVFSESGSITTTLTCFIVLTLLELIVSSHRLKICIPLSMNTSQGLHFTKSVTLHCCLIYSLLTTIFSLLSLGKHCQSQYKQRCIVTLFWTES